MSQGRLFELVYLLLERGQMTAKELSERFEVSIRTIYRDVDALSAAGVPVYATPGRNGGVALMDHYVLSKAALTDDEQSQLLTALRSLAGDDALGSSETLSKLSALFRRDQPDWLQVDMSRWGNSPDGKAKFAALKDAILTRKVISFTYVSSYGQTTARQALPARLVFKGQAWYLQGFCLDKQAYRTFKVSRMLGLSVTGQTFSTPLSPPPIDDPEAAAPCSVDLRLRFSPTQAFRVYDEFGESSVKALPDGSLEVSVSFPEDNWVYGYLLSFGLGVEVLEPERVRLGLGVLAHKISAHCKNPDTGCQGFGATMGTSQTKEDVFMNADQTFCQSCGMPLTDPTQRGAEKDGTPSPHYCKYCYQDGAFTGEMTMEEMIAFCAPMMAQSNPDMTEEQAKEQMRKFFPLLLRWKEADK